MYLDAQSGFRRPGDTGYGVRDYGLDKGEYRKNHEAFTFWSRKSVKINERYKNFLSRILRNSRPGSIIRM